MKLKLTALASWLVLFGCSSQPVVVTHPSRTAPAKTAKPAPAPKKEAEVKPADAKTGKEGRPAMHGV